MEAELGLNPRYIVNKTGKQISVVLRLKDYQSLIDRIQSLETEIQCRPSQPDPIIWKYTMPRKGACAYAVWKPPRLVVLKGSGVADGEAKMTKSYSKIRRSLIKNGVIEPNAHGSLIFTQDFAFSSLSAAASVVSGGSRNGDVWRDGQNRKLPDCKSALWGHR